MSPTETRTRALWSSGMLVPTRARARQWVTRLLESADIRVDGGRPWDPRVRDGRFFARVVRAGSLGLGDSYVDGWWECADLVEFFHRLLRRLQLESASWVDRLAALQARLLNLQTRWRARSVADAHYDLDASFFMSFLDRFNQYTCGYFRDTDELDAAQEKKLELICRKLRLRAGDQVVDIGCGWGGFARFAAERYGAHVTGVTISPEQARYARRFCRGLPVRVLECDYRDLHGRFDKALVCGMIEHVGYRNYRRLMDKVRCLLHDGGLFVLQTIGRNTTAHHGDPWITRHIFPNSMLPSLRQLAAAAEGLFVVEDVHNFGAHYEQTLLRWYERFRDGWPRFADRFGERFRRMWRYYLLSSAGAFRARSIQLWQIVLSPQGVPGGYVAPR